MFSPELPYYRLLLKPSPGVSAEYQEPTETSKQPIRTRYLGHVTGYQPIRDQYFLIRSVPGENTTQELEVVVRADKWEKEIDKSGTLSCYVCIPKIIDFMWEESAKLFVGT